MNNYKISRKNRILSIILAVFMTVLSTGTGLVLGTESAYADEVSPSQQIKGKSCSQTLEILKKIEPSIVKADPDLYYYWKYLCGANKLLVAETGSGQGEKVDGTFETYYVWERVHDLDTLREYGKKVSSEGSDNGKFPVLFTYGGNGFDYVLNGRNYSGDDINGSLSSSYASIGFKKGVNSFKTRGNMNSWKLKYKSGNAYYIYDGSGYQFYLGGTFFGDWFWDDSSDHYHSYNAPDLFEGSGAYSDMYQLIYDIPNKADIAWGYDGKTMFNTWEEDEWYNYFNIYIGTKVQEPVYSGDITIDEAQTIVWNSRIIGEDAHLVVNGTLIVTGSLDLRGTVTVGPKGTLIIGEGAEVGTFLDKNGTELYSGFKYNFTDSQVKNYRKIVNDYLIDYLYDSGKLLYDEKSGTGFYLKDQEETTVQEFLNDWVFNYDYLSYPADPANDPRGLYLISNGSIVVNGGTFVMEEGSIVYGLNYDERMAFINGGKGYIDGTYARAGRFDVIGSKSIKDGSGKVTATEYSNVEFGPNAKVLIGLAPADANTVAGLKNRDGMVFAYPKLDYFPIVVDESKEGALCVYSYEDCGNGNFETFFYENQPMWDYIKEKEKGSDARSQDYLLGLLSEVVHDNVKAVNILDGGSVTFQKYPYENGKGHRNAYTDRAEQFAYATVWYSYDADVNFGSQGMSIMPGQALPPAKDDYNAERTTFPTHAALLKKNNETVKAISKATALSDFITYQHNLGNLLNIGSDGAYPNHIVYPAACYNNRSLELYNKQQIIMYPDLGTYRPRSIW